MFHQVIADPEQGPAGYKTVDIPLERGPNECLVANLPCGRVVVTDVPNLWRSLPPPKAKGKVGRPRKKPAAAAAPASDDEYPEEGPPEEEEEEEPPEEEEEEEEPPEDDEAAEAARLLKRPAAGLLKRPAAGLLKRPAAGNVKGLAVAAAAAPNVEETPQAAPMTPEPEKKEALAAPEAEEHEAPAAPEAEEEEAPPAPEQLHRRSPKRSGPPVEYRLEKYRTVHAIGVCMKGGVQLFQFGGKKRAAHLTFRDLKEIGEEACRKLADDQPLEEVKLWAKSQLRQ